MAQHRPNPASAVCPRTDVSDLAFDADTSTRVGRYRTVSESGDPIYPPDRSRWQQVEGMERLRNVLMSHSEVLSYE